MFLPSPGLVEVETVVNVTMGLSVILPAYNEEGNLKETAECILAAARTLGCEYELVIVNDGSTDRTRGIAEGLAASHSCVLAVHHPGNWGMGAALRTGIAASQHKLIMLIPADSPLDAEQMSKYIEAGKDVDIVVGYRQQRLGYKGWMRVASRVYHSLLETTLGLKLRDYNWIPLYQRGIFERVRIRFPGMIALPEVLVKATKYGYRIAEIPCPMRPRTRGRATSAKLRSVAATLWDFFWLWWEVKTLR